MTTIDMSGARHALNHVRAGVQYAFRYRDGYGWATSSWLWSRRAHEWVPSIGFCHGDALAMAA